MDTNEPTKQENPEICPKCQRQGTGWAILCGPGAGYVRCIACGTNIREITPEEWEDM